MGAKNPKWRVRPCKRCGEKPVLHIVPFFDEGLPGLACGFVCRKCTPTKAGLFRSLVKAKKFWNYANK